jgi:hypothetical protein
MFKHKVKNLLKELISTFVSLEQCQIENIIAAEQNLQSRAGKSLNY